MKNEVTNEMILAEFGFSPENLNCADVNTAMGEVFENDCNSNPLDLLVQFIETVTHRHTLKYTSAW